MTETTKPEKEKDFATRLADAGGEAMQKLSDLPMGKVLADGAQQVRERLDELGTRIRAIDPTEIALILTALLGGLASVPLTSWGSLVAVSLIALWGFGDWSVTPAQVQRITALEQRLETLEKKSKPTARKSPAKKSTAKKSTASKTTAKKS